MLSVYLLERKIHGIILGELEYQFPGLFSDLIDQKERSGIAARDVLTFLKDFPEQGHQIIFGGQRDADAGQFVQISKAAVPHSGPLSLLTFEHPLIAGHLENFDSLPVGQRVCQDQVGVDIEGIRTEKDGFREFFRPSGEINIPQ